MNNKNIAIVTSELSGLPACGGIGSANFGLARTLVDNDYSVYIIYTKWLPIDREKIYKKLFKDEYGIELLFLDHDSTEFIAPFELRIQHSLYDFFINFNKKIDVCITQDYLGEAALISIHKRLIDSLSDAKFITVTHGPSIWTRSANNLPVKNEQELYLSDLERVTIENSEYLVSPSKYLINFLISKNYDINDSHIIQNILPVDFMSFKSKNFTSVRKIIFFGRLEPRKGVKLFIEAIKLIPQKLANNLEIEFLAKPGSISFNSISDELSEFKIKLISNLDQEGAARYLEKWAHNALVVVPSYDENSPSVVIEMLEIGVRFLASRVGGIPELISENDIDQVTFYTKPYDLADKITRSLLNTEFEKARPRKNSSQRKQCWLDFIDKITKLEIVKSHKIAHSSPEHEERNPTVTVCVTTFNRPKFLAECLNSIVEQDYGNLKCIIINDGGKEEAVKKLVKSFGEHIQIEYVYQENKYLGAARNTALEHVDTEFVFFIDDDDLMAKDAITRLINVQNLTGADYVLTSLMEFKKTEELNLIKRGGLTQKWVFLGGQKTTSRYFSNNIGPSCGLFRTATVKSIRYTEHYGVGHEDYNLYLRSLQEGIKIYTVLDACVFYRVTDSSMVRSTNDVENYFSRIDNTLVDPRAAKEILELAYFKDRVMYSTPKFNSKNLGSKEFEVWKKSRFYRLATKYYELFGWPIVGPILRQLRNIVGKSRRFLSMK